MALRFLMVSLVASMGLELPSGQEVSCWTRAGREWAGARLFEFSAYRADAERIFLGSPAVEAAPVVAESGPSTADLAFDVVVEGLASTFADDLASVGDDAPGSSLDAFAETGVTGPPILLAWSDPEPSMDPTPPPDPRSTPTRGDRFSSAVRLTRQAVSAWASLIVGTSGDLADSR